MRDIGVPVLVGAVLQGPGPDHVSNTGIVWDPATGAGQRYVKRHPVPFGEYIPFREQLTGLIARLDQIPRDFYAGDRPGQPRPSARPRSATSSASRSPTTGWSATSSAAAPRSWSCRPTTRPTTAPASRTSRWRCPGCARSRPAGTCWSPRPAASARSSAPDGSVAARAPEKVARTLVAEVPLRDGQTLATRLGAWPEWLLAGRCAGGRRRSAWCAGARGRAATAPEATGDRGEAPGGLPARWPRGAGVLVVVPTYDEAAQRRGRRRPGCARPSRWRTCWSSTTTARTAPVRSPTRWPPPTRRCTCCTGPAKEGLGPAYLAGFGWGLERGYDVLVEMDADGSHQPEQLPALLAALPDADLVLGSRWVPGGSVVNWPLRRRLLSQGGNAYVRRALGIGRPGRDRRLPGLPAYHAGEARPRRRGQPGLLLPGRPRLARPCSRASGSSRCRSSSSSGSAE